MLTIEFFWLMGFSRWSEMSACGKHKYFLMSLFFNNMNIKVMARHFLIIGSILMCFLEMLSPCNMYKNWKKYDWKNFKNSMSCHLTYRSSFVKTKEFTKCYSHPCCLVTDLQKEFLLFICKLSQSFLKEKYFHDY